MNMNHGLESKLLAYDATGLNSWLNVRFFFFFVVILGRYLNLCCVSVLHL